MTISTIDSTARAKALARLDERTMTEPNSGCWLFTGTLSNGYGQTYAPGFGGRAHRVSYQIHVGDIPEGLVLDHLCRNRACINPSHLEAVTPATNVRRGRSGVLHKACKRGHLMDEANTVRRRRSDGSGARECRACKRVRSAASKLALRSTKARRARFRPGVLHLQIKRTIAWYRVLIPQLKAASKLQADLLPLAEAAEQELAALELGLIQATIVKEAKP